MTKFLLLPFRVSYCIVVALCVWLMIAVGTLVVVFTDMWNATDD